MCNESFIDFEKYVVFEDGRIFSKYWGKYLRFTITKEGYKRGRLFLKNGKQGSFRLHRVIWYFFNGDIPEGLQINHIDENKLNNSLSNLTLVTPKENSNWGTRNNRISSKLKGKKKTNEFRKILSEKLKGRKFSEEWRRKQSESHNGKISPRRKTVLQYDIEEKKIINKYNSVMEAAKLTGFSSSCISASCRGDYFGSNKYKNYIWKYDIH